MTMTPTELLLNVLGGLGLFFVGIKMISRNLNALASEQFRRRIRRVSESLWIAMSFGALAGFITQSGRTTAIIMGSFVQGGLIEARRALPIVLWANLGCTLIVFAAVFPIHLFALFLLGAAGGCIAFERPRPLLSTANATFGLAMMLFGLRMMSASASVLMEFDWFTGAVDFINTSLALAFLTGVVLTFIAQSHMAIILITVAFSHSGIFDFNQAVMVIFGTHVGASLITYVTGIHFRGEPRQLVLAQILYNLIGVALFLAIFLGLYLASGDLSRLQALARAYDKDVAVGAAGVLVLLNLVTPLLLTILRGPYQRLCEDLSPPREEEELAKPHYLRQELGDNPVATLMLGEKEQLRLLKRLPDYFARLRDDGGHTSDVTPEFHHMAFQEVSRQIHQFQGRLMANALSHEDTEWLLNQQNRQELLNGLEDTCYALQDAVGAARDPDVVRLATGIVEALDTVVLTAISAMETGDTFELDLLDKMTLDRGATMENIRKTYLTSSPSMAPDARNQILHITSLFERATWALRRFATLLRESPAVQE